jgi:hypothetical protein
MTWETFDADWTEEPGQDHEDLPYTAAFTRDDGIRLEMFTYDGMRIVEVSDPDQDVIMKAVFAVDDAGAGKLIPIQGWDPEFWRRTPSIAVAALRYAERTWHPREAENDPSIHV